MGMFGGGGGVDVSAGVNAVKQGTQQGLSALQQYYQQAVPALEKGAQQAQNYYAPYGLAGASSLDALQDLMGLARPEAGSFALTQALQNEGTLSDAIKGKHAAHPMDIGSLSNASGINFEPGSFLADQIAQAKQAGGYMFNQNTGGLYTSAPGTGHGNSVDMNDAGVKSVRGPDGRYHLESTDVQGRVLTPEEQAQWDMIDKYKKGTLGMTNGTARSNSALEQLMQSPGYQFTLSQGLQGVDRSAAARGLTGSGAAIKGASNYASGLAQKTYNDRVSQLSAGAGMGQQTANQQAQTAGSLGGSLATLASNMGSNTASLYGAQANGLASIYGGKAAADGQQTSSLYGLAGSLLGSIF